MKNKHEKNIMLQTTKIKINNKIQYYMYNKT